MIETNDIYFLINRFYKVEPLTYYLALEVLDTIYYEDVDI